MMAAQVLERMARRRRLAWLSSLAALLGLARLPGRAVAANGDKILAGLDPGLNWATARTWLQCQAISRVFRVEVASGNADAIQAEGGPSGAAGVGGTGLVGRGRGSAIAARGGDATTARAGSGVSAMGGRGIALGGGIGIEARGGRGTSVEGGAGISARAGVGPAGTRPPAVRAFGGNSADAGTASAIGVRAVGGGQAEAWASGLVGTTSAATQAAIIGRNIGGGDGISGRSVLGGTTNPPPGEGTGVRGLSNSGPGGYFTSVEGAGAAGVSTSGSGSRGWSTSGQGASGVSVSSAGVVGTSPNGFGVVALSTQGVGGYFETGELTQFALIATNTQAAGENLGNGSLGLLVVGDFMVANGVKPAVLETSQGTTRFYAMEGAIAVFEDFGRASLVNGTARVALDPLFAETIDTGSYWVFLTPRSAATRGLAVVTRDAAGFTVQEAQGGTGNYPFDYRVVAQRKGVTPAHRLRNPNLGGPPNPPPPPTPTPTPVPTWCSPRPNVGVSVRPAGPGLLQATITANTSAGTPTNWLTELRFGTPRPFDNAVVDVQGGPTGISSSQTVSLPTGTTMVSFSVRRVRAGQATTVPLVVVDRCGDWPTFVGGGPNAF